MPTQVCFFRTTDGTLFDTVDQAVEYENRQLVIEYLNTKSSVFVNTDTQDIIKLALTYLAQPGSPVTLTYAEVN